MHSIALRSCIWLFTEIVLTAIGTDDIADYGEYIFKMKNLLGSQQTVLIESICDSDVCWPNNLNFRIVKVAPF
jgi:hypothetical protein